MRIRYAADVRLAYQNTAHQDKLLAERASIVRTRACDGKARQCTDTYQLDVFGTALLLMMIIMTLLWLGKGWITFGPPRFLTPETAVASGGILIQDLDEIIFLVKASHRKGFCEDTSCDN